MYSRVQLLDAELEARDMKVVVETALDFRDLIDACSYDPYAQRERLLTENYVIPMSRG